MQYFSNLIESLIVEISQGALIFFGGFLTSKIISKRKKEKNSKIFEESVHIAADIIYESEVKFPGASRGPEKLSYAVKQFVDKTGFDDYEKAQNYIVQVFNMTKFSEPDIPIRKNVNNN